MMPIIGHSRFLPGLTDPYFSSLSPQGPMRASKLLGTNGWLAMKTLFPSSSTSLLPQWRALQLSHLLQSLPKHTLFPRELHAFEEPCLGRDPIRGSLSTSYKHLLELHACSDPPFLAKWERELGVTFSGPQKERILFFVHKSSLCSRYQETTYKLMTHWYRTPSVLA